MYSLGMVGDFDAQGGVLAKKVDAVVVGVSC